jgi:hypothetical protein
MKDGLELWGSKVEHYVHEIEGNTVNGKPLYYFYEENNFDVPSDAGQIIIVDCRQARIEDTVINDTSTGLLIAFTDMAKITYSEFSKNHMGAYLYYSSQVTFRRNNFIKNRIHSRFVGEGFVKSKSNLWRNNYWQNIIGSEARLLKRIPRKITGICHFKNYMDRFRLIPFILVREYDIMPARVPYNIK